MFVVVVFAACGGGGGTDTASTPSLAVEPVVVPAAFPVGLVGLPDGSLLYSELKTGAIRFLIPGSPPALFARVDVPAAGADGLLGLAIDADYASNQFVYAFYTDPRFRNRVVRFVNSRGVGIDPRVIVDNLPYGGHNGGKLAAAQDGTLYVSTGDTGIPALAQDPNSLAGKILRYTRDGAIPPDNPNPASPVFALGLRNVFGLALDSRNGTLYATDNGPECDDEINRVTAGANYGWRAGQVCSEQTEFVPPVVVFPQPRAVTGITFYRGGIFGDLQDELLLADYNSGSIRRYRISSDGAVQSDSELYAGGSGPILELATGADGFIYFTAQEGVFRIVPGQ